MENGGLEPDLSEAIMPTPIAQLQPGLSDIASHIVDGEVTITWPFSIVTKSIAFKLAEHDFLLRRNKGQVRVEFHGAAGKAVAATGIGGGDKVRLSLAGVEWTEGAPASTRPDTLQWQMNFSSRLRMRVRRTDSQEEEIISVDSSESIDNDPPLTELTAPSVSEPEHSTPIPTDTPPKPAIYPRDELRAPLTGKRQVSEAFDADEYASPAFLKRARISYGSLFEGGFDIFNEHDDDVPSKKKDHKRPRFSMNANWKYTSRTPSPEPEQSPEVEPEPLAGNNDAPDVLMETPSRLLVADKEKQDRSIEASASPVPSKATETRVPSSQRASTPSSPCIQRTAPEEEPQDDTEQTLKSSGDTESSLQLAEVDTQSEPEKTSLEPDSLLRNDPSKPQDIMDQFLHDAIDPALTDEAGEAADLVMENNAGRFLEDHELQFAPMPTYTESQPPMASFSHLPNGEPHGNHSFSTFPTQSNDWLPMSSAPVYPPIPAPNSLNNPVEIIDSSSSDGEQSSDEGDAEREDDGDQLRGSSLKSEDEDSDHSHMEDSEQEALQQGREDFQMDDDESEEGTDVAGEDYDLRNYDDAQADDSAGNESEEEDPHTPNEAGNLINVADEQSSHFINEQRSLNNGEIGSSARTSGLVPIDARADSDSESNEDEDEEDEEEEEEQEQEEYYEGEEENVHEYEEEEYYEEGEEEYEEEEEEKYEEADNSTPPPPQNPVFIDLMSDSDDEEELDHQEPHKEEPEVKGSADAHEPDTSTISAHQQEVLGENEESQEPNLALTQGTTEEPASINVDASEQPIPAHPDQPDHSATENSVLTFPETLVNTGKQSQAQSNRPAATDSEPRADSIKQYGESQETVTISNGQTQTQTVVGLGEQSPEVQLDEKETQVTESQEIECKDMRGEISSPSFEDATSQEKDGSNHAMFDADMDVPPSVEQGEPIFITDMEQASTAGTPEQPATSDLPPTEPTQRSPVSASKPIRLSITDENMGVSIGKASSPTSEQTSPKLVESVSAEISSNIAAVPTGKFPTVEQPAVSNTSTDTKDLANDSAGEDTTMQESSLILGETNQLDSLQQTNLVQDEIEVKDGLVSPPPTEMSQQVKTTDEVVQPVAATVEVEEVIYVETVEDNATPHEPQPNDAMDIDQIDDEHDHDAEYSFAAEQQIISESQEYQDMSMTDTLQSEVDTGTSVPSEPVEKEKKAPAKPERDMLITVQSLRSRGHRKSLSSDSTSTRNQDPSILLAKANTGAAEPDLRRKHKTPPVIHTGRITRSQVEAGVAQTAGSPHTPTRSMRHGATPETPHGSQASGVTRKGRSKSPASTSELLKTPSVAGSSAAAAAAAADGEPISELKLRLLRDLRTNLGEFTPLKSLRNLASRTTDILAIATTTPPQPSRPKNGPRDYMVELILTDPSCAPSTVAVAHFFRPHQASLPTVHAGDVVLLRRFQVVSVRKRGFGIRTSEGSAWAVFEKGDEEMLPQIKGPPVELSDAEVAYAEGLRRWWALLDDKVKAKIEKATEKSVQLAARDEK